MQLNIALALWIILAASGCATPNSDKIAVAASALSSTFSWRHIPPHIMHLEIVHAESKTERETRLFCSRVLWNHPQFHNLFFEIVEIRFDPSTNIDYYVFSAQGVYDGPLVVFAHQRDRPTIEIGYIVRVN